MGRPLPTAWKMLPIFLLGAALRLFGLNNLSPPGLEHDEVAHWLINRAILDGQHAVYFTEAYGHEAGFHYVQAIAGALLGDHALALRLPAALMGILGVAVTFILARRLFGERVALTSAALLAVLFFPVFYSRLGLRAIMLPLLSGLSAYFWWRGWRVAPVPEAGEGGERPELLPAPRHATRYLLLAGLFAGLSLHTYMAARVVPIFYALFMIGLILLKPAIMRARWRQMLLFWAVLIAVASPLAIYLLTNPGAEIRIGEVDAPLRALRQGDARPIVDNFVDILGSFGFAGDPLWRQNVAGMPVFDPLLALLFYACLGLACLYVRDVRYLFLILWALTATIPSIVTIDAPSSIRMINILPVLTILPAIVMHNMGRLSTEMDRLSTAPVDKWLLPLLVCGLVLFHTGRTARAIFITWPAHEEVRFVWQEALTSAAAFLDQSPAIRDVAVAGWTPDTMDAPTMALTLRREDLTLRFFDPQQSLLIPSSDAGAPAWIVRPAALPIDPALRRPLGAPQVVSATHGSFVSYRFQDSLQPAPDIAQEATFGDALHFLGYSASDACRPRDGGTDCIVVTFWRVLQPPAQELRLFLHLVDGQGVMIGDADALGAPSEFWQRGDLLLQKHTISADLLPATEALQLGIYKPASGQRLLTTGGQEFVRLRP